MAQKAVRSARGSWVKSAVKLTDKTVIITGANTGIGLETALDLAKRDARIIIACRDLEKAKAAKSKIEAETGSNKIDFKHLDLSSFNSIRAFAGEINKTEPKLDILVNNAGVMKVPQGKTKDGFETQFGINHLGTFLLTNLLLDLMKKNEKGRIVTLSSIAHLFALRIKWNDLNFSKNYKPMDAYNASKLMNILFTRELSQRLAGSGITTYAVHPGVVDTELNRTVGEDKTFYGWLTDFCFRRKAFIKTPKHGAQTSIYCAIAPELEGVSGKYYSNCKTAWTSPLVNDKNASRLWRVSEELTGLRDVTQSSTAV